MYCWAHYRINGCGCAHNANGGSLVGAGGTIIVEPEILYRQLGRLLETAPDFVSYGNLSSDQLRWLGRAHALVRESGIDLHTQSEVHLAIANMQGVARLDALQIIMMALYKVLAGAELKAPAAAQGAFIPAGNRFDAFSAITKVLQSAKHDVFIVDPYLDETVMTVFGGSVPDGITLRLLSDEASVKASLTPAAKIVGRPAWNDSTASR